MQGLKNPENCESNKEQLFLPDRPCVIFINQAQPDGHVLGCIILNIKSYSKSQSFWFVKSEKGHIYLLNREKEKNENKKPQFTFLCLHVSYFFSCYCNPSAQQIYNLEWGSGVGTNFIIFWGSTGASKTGLMRKLRTGCGCFYMVDTTGTWDEILFSLQEW